MAEKISLQIDAKVGDAVNATKTLKQQLKEATNEAQNLAAKYGETSTEAINAAKKTAILKEKLADFKGTVDALNPEAKFKAIGQVAQGIAGGFTAATGAMAVFGIKSEDTEKALLKVQGALALSEGLNTIMGLGDAFGNLKTVIMNGVKSLGTLKGALVATGIGAFAVAIGLIIENWTELKNKIDKTFPSLGGIANLFDNLKKVAFGTLSSIVEGFKVVGEVIGDVFSGEFGKAVDVAKTFGKRVSVAYTAGFKEEEKNQANERRIVLLESQQKDHERTLKVLEAQGKDTYAFKRKMLNDELELLKLQNKKETDEYKNKLNEIKILDITKSIADKKAREDAEKEAFKIKKEKDAERLAEMKLLNDELQANKTNTIRLESDTAKTIIDIQKEVPTAAEISRGIMDEADLKSANQKIETAQYVVNSLSSLNDALNTIQKNGLKKGEKLSIEQEKKAFNRNKALSITQAAINTASAITKGIAQFGPPPSPAGIAAIVAASTVGLAQIAAISSKKFSPEGGDSSVSTSVSGGGGAGSSASGGANLGGATPNQQSTLLQNANINSSALNQNFVKAVVVETDITDAQNRIQGIQNKSKFG